MCSARVGLKWGHDLDTSARFSKGLELLKGEGWAGKSPCGSPRGRLLGPPSRKKVLFGRRKARRCRAMGYITVPMLLFRSSLAEQGFQGLAILVPSGTPLTGCLCPGGPVGFVETKSDLHHDRLSSAHQHHPLFPMTCCHA